MTSLACVVYSFEVGIRAGDTMALDLHFYACFVSCIMMGPHARNVEAYFKLSENEQVAFSHYEGMLGLRYRNKLGYSTIQMNQKCALLVRDMKFFRSRTLRDIKSFELATTLASMELEVNESH